MDWDEFKKGKASKKERDIIRKALAPNFPQVTVTVKINDTDMMDQVCGDDETMRFFFKTRFFWFLEEMTAQVTQSKAEDAIMSTPGFWRLPKKEQDKRLEPLYKNWRHDLFSPESFDRYLKQLMKKDDKEDS